MQIVRADDSGPKSAVPPGTPQIHNLSLSTLRERMTRYARYEKHTEKWGWSRAVPSDHIVAATLERKKWPGIRSIVGVAETPFLRPDGSLCQTAGYDPSTKYEYTPSVTFQPVADRPTEGDAREAYKLLRDVFYDFPYTIGPSVPIAAILTLLARPAIQGATPCFAFDATTRSAGKSLQTDVIATIVTGRSMPRAAYPKHEDEVEKVLAAYALRGVGFFSFDNVARLFGGPAIDLYVTARDTVEVRILGKSKMPNIPWRGVMFANGNNLRYFGDTASRILRARIEPQEEHPESRTQFRHDLPAYASEQRIRLVHAALTLLRAYTTAGSPNMGSQRWGRFEEWSRLIPHAILFAGGEDPLLSRPSSDSEVDEHAASIHALMIEVEWMYLEKEKKDWRASELLEDAFKDQEKETTEEKEHFGNLREAITNLCDPKPGMRPDPRELGRKLQSAKGRVIDGRRIEVRPGQGGIARYQIVPVD